MSAINRPTSRWSSSTKSSSSTNQTAPLMASRKKFYRPLQNNQHAFGQRMARTKHDIEQLFKLYYSNNIKFDTFQKQMITGTRIPSAPTSILIQNHLTNSSSNMFHSKHCVSPEQMNPIDINEQQIINNELKQIPIKRTVEVRIDNNPSPLPEDIPISSNSDLITPENEFHEPSTIKTVPFIEDIPTDYHEHNHIKKSKSAIGQYPMSSITPLPPVSLANVSLMNNRKDTINLSHSSFSTVNSLQQLNRSHIVTGTAVIARERSPTKLALLKQRRQSCSQQTNLKTSAISIQYDQPEFPVCLGSRVVSIPSKYSRYVLLTFPQVPIRYHAPTYVERLLLPERFPTLFQNIVHNHNNK